MRNSECGMQNTGSSGLWTDNGAHLLHFGGRSFPCDRDVEALAAWRDHALLLSSDTDCLSLWDGDGLVRLARVGVYPQDMAVQGDAAYVCGGADGRVHRLNLPDLRESADFPLPGMPERIALYGESAYVLTLLADAEVETALLCLSLSSGRWAELRRFPGLPGAIAADGDGLWVGVSELLCRLPFGTDTPDITVEGLGLPRRILLQADGVLVTDPLEGPTARVTHAPRPAIEIMRWGDADDFVFSR